MDDIKRLKNALLRYRQHQCMLFVGAGFSIGAGVAQLNGSNSPLPTGRELAATMAARLNETEMNLSTIADLYEEEFGENGLYALLKDSYVANEVSRHQCDTIQYAWKEIYTTNYDNVVELCCGKLGKKYSSFGPLKSPSDIDNKSLAIVHINGLVAGTNFSDFKSEIKLTDVQYYSEDFSRSKWGTRFRHDLSTSPCAIFLGYSLYDLDVARIINEFEGMKERIFFVVSIDPPRSERKRLEKFGAVLSIGLNGFAKIISEVVTEPAVETEVYFAAWERIALTQSPAPQIKDRDVVNFFMTGNLDPLIFANDVLKNENNALINREAADSIVEKIVEGKSINSILISNIGNGKTTALDTIGYKLAARNYFVLRASSTSSLLLKEVSQIRNINAKIVLLIDDIYTHKNLVRAIRSTLGNEVSIVATARTSQFELQEDDVREIFEGDMLVYDLDRLGSVEIERLVALMDQYYLWGDMQSQSTDAKKRFISQDCFGELRTVVLYVMNSPTIQNRIREILDFQEDPVPKEKALSVLITSQLLNLADIGSDLSLISEMLGFDAREAIKKQEQRLRDFTLVRNGKITIKSALFSEYVLSKLIDTAFVVEVMTKCMEKLDLIHDDDDMYKSVFKNFSRYRLIESAMDSKTHGPRIIKYFENIKILGHCKKQSLFWLQYALCRIALSHYKDAERLIEVAYSFARMSGFKENRHLDNLHAKFLLVSRTSSNDYQDFMAAFNKAHAICIKQIRDEPNSRNPLKVASLYSEFVERRTHDFSQGDLLGIFRSCNEVLNLTSIRGKSNPNSFELNTCDMAMQKSIRIVRSKLSTLGVNV